MVASPCGASRFRLSDWPSRKTKPAYPEVVKHLRKLDGLLSSPVGEDQDAAGAKVHELQAHVDTRGEWAEQAAASVEQVLRLSMCMRLLLC